MSDDPTYLAKLFRRMTRGTKIDYALENSTFIRAPNKFVALARAASAFNKVAADYNDGSRQPPFIIRLEEMP